MYGRYTHMPNCDAPEKSLFVKDLRSENPKFLFKDPTKCGDPRLDTFVISPDPRLIHSHEHREFWISFLPPSIPHKQLHKLKRGKPVTLKFTMDGFWEKVRGPLEMSHLRDPSRGMEVLCMPRDVNISLLDCHRDNRPIVEFQVWRTGVMQDRVLRKLAWGHSNSGDWVNIPKHDLRPLSQALAFANVKIANHMERLEISSNSPRLCKACSPEEPTTYWIKDGANNVLKPYQKIADIEQYELALKTQEPIFQMQAKVSRSDTEDDDWNVRIRVVINPTRLLHRVVRHLPKIEKTFSQDPAAVRFEASAEPHHADCLLPHLDPFSTAIRALDAKGKMCDQPPSFFLTENRLEPEQRITVAWMQCRENDPIRFPECETEEEIIPGVQIRLLARAMRDVVCGGGIVADDVGFGKTVMTIAMLDLQHHHDERGYIERKSRQEISGSYALNATLIIVPEHIIHQWKCEIIKFIGSQVRILIIEKDTNLNRCTLGQLEGASVVLVSSVIFSSNSYRNKLATWAGRVEYGSKELTSERTYNAWHDDCLHSIRSSLCSFLKNDAQEQRDKLIESIKEHKMSSAETNQQLLEERAIKRSVQSEAAPLLQPATADEEPKISKKAAKTSSKQEMQRSRMFYEQDILFEFFSWSRIVWDEFSYENVAVTQYLSSAATPHKWLLSATPPKQNLKNIANLSKALGIHLARPVDLRLGLPRVCEGPVQSPQTEMEVFRSYGKMKSDKFVEERHQQARTFLESFSCSNEAPQFTKKIFEQVVVCPPTLVERAYYEDQQQAWRKAQMKSDQLPTEVLAKVLESLDNETSDIPATRDLLGPALIHAASLPMLQGQQIDSIIPLCIAKRQALEEAKAYLRQLQEKFIYIGRQVLKCQKMDKDALERVTLRMQDYFNALQDGKFGIFGGFDGYVLALESILPDLPFSRADILGQLKQGSGISLAGLRASQLLPKVQGQDLPSLMEDLFVSGDFTWAHFYVVEPNDVEELDEENIVNLLTDYARLFPHEEDGEEQAVKEIAAMDLEKLRTTLLYLVTELQEAREASKRPVEPGFETELRKWSDAEIKRAGRLRGLRFKSTTSKSERIDLILQDEVGGAGQSCYSGASIRALNPTEMVPRLHTIMRARNTKVPEAKNEFDETYHKLKHAVKNLFTQQNQFRRALRFSYLQHGSALQCDECGSTEREALSLIFECGHVLCHRCLDRKSTCGTGSTGCPSILRYSEVPIDTIGHTKRELNLFERLNDQIMDSSSRKLNQTSIEQTESSAVTTCTSSKLQLIINIVKRIPGNASVVLFAQYDKIIAAIIRALRESGILCESTTDLRGRRPSASNHSSSRVLSEFKERKFRVLVQKLTSSEAAGSNLTHANHIIFAHPLVVKSQDQYDSNMKQAKGRCIRRGQENDVYIYHCVVEGTVEVDILESREKKQVRVQPGLAVGGFASPGTCEEDLTIKAWYDHGKSESELVNSVLTPSEIWQIMDENDYLTTIGMEEFSSVSAAAEL
ncbi:hypothetical protein BX600DRAFT_537678 [Xylariales sp. PMI_506]|nr:hypothetical protein BX600DRAFT_537678 [Xylariales sp. PMI_506]